MVAEPIPDSGAMANDESQSIEIKPMAYDYDYDYECECGYSNAPETNGRSSQFVQIFRQLHLHIELELQLNIFTTYK